MTPTHARHRFPAPRTLLLPALLGLAVLALVFVPEAHAQFGLNTAASGAGLKNPGIPALIGRILKALLGFVGTLFLILMVYAGFLWMTARGDSKKVDQAKQLITGAVIGVVIIAASYAITDLVIKSVTGTAQTTSQTAPETPEGPSCTLSCTTPLDCGPLPDSCGICSSCKCADGSLSTNNNPCPSTGSCLCH
jgi:type IV secretion system pilin